MTENNNLNLYLNPQLSLLSFNERVLHMALKPTTPLLERLKFLCIFSSNMDEFFEIRVSGLKAQAASNISTEGADGLTPKSILEKISEQAHLLVDLQYQILNEQVFPELEKHGIRFLTMDQWSNKQRKWLKDYFKRQVLPILTPIRLDPAHPFPLTINKGLGIVVDLHDPERDDAHNIAVVPAPRALPRFIRLPEELCENEYEYVYLSSVIHAHIKKLFSNVKVLGCHQFRITRNSDLYVDLEEVEDLARTLEGELPSRLYGEAIRLEVSKNCPKRITAFLRDRFKLSEDMIYQVNGPVNLNRLISLPDIVNRPTIKYLNYSPSVPEYLGHQSNLFEAISNGDILLHHPFQSFAPVVDFLRQAATDPSVLVIKQTLYRTGPDSIMVEHLAAAARSGKEVTVVIELMARFDEQNNLTTAERLQAAGAHVVYGMVGKKTHAKMLLVVRRESGKLRRYGHLGTGNYHQGNTRVYTDYGLITKDKQITHDVHEIFMQLTTQSSNPELNRLYQSPFGIANMFTEKLRREAVNAKAGKASRVIVKVNGLSSPGIINELYEASQAGVKVDLIVRGICCLRPGLSGVSENITVRSVVGRFLEHGRVFYFLNDSSKTPAEGSSKKSAEGSSLTPAEGSSKSAEGSSSIPAEGSSKSAEGSASEHSELFISSADLMPRNLRNRIEQCTPVLDKKLKDQILGELELYLQDSTEAWVMQADGRYKPTISDKDDDSFTIQGTLLNRYTEQL